MHGITYGAHSIKGKRPYQEDRIHTDYDSVAGFYSFSVFDGHGGDQLAEFAKNRFTRFFRRIGNENPGATLLETLNMTYLELHDKAQTCARRSGTTAVSVVATPTHLHVANAGDSIALLVTPTTAKSLTYTHKPTDEVEKKRIISLGGSVYGGRVSGCLAVSRALGDYELNPFVTPEPSLLEHALQPEDSVVVIASDGVTDVMGDDEIASFVREEMGKGLCAQIIAQNLVNKAHADGSTDNISAIVVFLK